MSSDKKKAGAAPCQTAAGAVTPRRSSASTSTSTSTPWKRRKLAAAERHRKARSKFLRKARARNELAEAAVKAKHGEGCWLCGSRRFTQWHHIMLGARKRAKISGLRRTGCTHKFADELDKCCLLCSRCHSAIHAGRLPLPDRWLARALNSWAELRAIPDCVRGGIIQQIRAALDCCDKESLAEIVSFVELAAEAVNARDSD